MPHNVMMPKFGWSMTEGIITEWLKKNGDEVKKGEPIALVETEKATAEVESPASGIFYAIKPAGSVVPTFERIAYIVDPREKLSDEIMKMLKSREKIKVKKLEVVEHIKASPLAKKVAKERNINISKVEGTRRGGIITKDDVLSYAQKLSAPPAVPTLTPEQAAEVRPSGALKGREEIIPLIGWRKTMSDRMSYSMRNAAQITTIAEVDATELVKLREKVNKEACMKITYTAFIVKAVTQALQEYPILNSSLIDDQIVIKKYYNIGVAMEREKGGLIVPVIHQAERKSVVELAECISQLKRKTRQGKISVEDVKGGTFTITNVGMLGVVMNTPIINPPESAILGVGAIVKKPVVLDDQITIRWMMYLCLTYDHQIIDGAPAIRLLQRVKQLLENPTVLLTGSFNY